MFTCIQRSVAKALDALDGTAPVPDAQPVDTQPVGA